MPSTAFPTTPGPPRAPLRAYLLFDVCIASMPTPRHALDAPGLWPGKNASSLASFPLSIFPNRKVTRKKNQRLSYPEGKPGVVPVSPNHIEQWCRRVSLVAASH